MIFNKWLEEMKKKMATFEEESAALGYDVTHSPKMDWNDEDSYYSNQLTGHRWSGFLMGYATKSLEQSVRIEEGRELFAEIVHYWQVQSCACPGLFDEKIQQFLAKGG